MHLWLCSHVLVARSVRLPEIHHWTRSWCLHFAYTIYFAFTQIKVEVGCVEFFCNSNTYLSPTKCVSSCNCKELCGVVSGHSDLTPYVVLHDTADMIQTMCSNWCTSCVTCSATGLALSEFLLLARWVLRETQVIDKNACIWRGYVLWGIWHSDLCTINRPTIHQHIVYC